MDFGRIFGYVLPSLPWGLAFWMRFGFLTGFSYLFCYTSRATGESGLEVYSWVVFDNALATCPK